MGRKRQKLFDLEFFPFVQVTQEGKTKATTNCYFSASSFPGTSKKVNDEQNMRAKQKQDVWKIVLTTNGKKKVALFFRDRGLFFCLFFWHLLQLLYLSQEGKLLPIFYFTLLFFFFHKKKVTSRQRKSVWLQRSEAFCWIKPMKMKQRG